MNHRGRTSLNSKLAHSERRDSEPQQPKGQYFKQLNKEYWFVFVEITDNKFGSSGPQKVKFRLKKKKKKKSWLDNVENITHTYHTCWHY